MFEFKPEPVPISSSNAEFTELASVHGHVKARFPTISSVQSSFLPGRKLFGDGAWPHFLDVGW